MNESNTWSQAGSVEVEVPRQLLGIIGLACLGVDAHIDTLLDPAD